jgi:hypothetical protein
MSSVNPDLRRRLDEVDASISGLQATRWALVQHLNLALAGTKRPLLSKFSDELIAEIFMHCLEPYSRITTHRYAPMLLLHVCRAWRSIALSTPGLWATLNVDFNCLPQTLFETGNLDKVIDDHVARAGTSPLSIQIAGGRDIRTRQVGRYLIPAILERLSSCIQVLELHITAAEFPQYTLDFPFLRKLTLRTPYHWGHGGDPVAFPIPTFGAARHIREVVLRRSYTDTSSFIIPWQNVAIFQGVSLSSEICIDVLRLASNLVECSLSSPELEEIPLPVSHSGIKSLKLEESDILLEFLTFPALQHLDLSFIESDNPHLLPFISRSAPSLVTLRGPAIPVQMLFDMTALTSLTIPDPSSAYLAEFFALFDRTRHPNNFLPKLEVLELERCLPYVSRILVDALASRCTGEPKLRSFRQIWPYGTPTDSLQGYYHQESFAGVLIESVKKGLKIYIGTENLPGRGAALFNSKGRLFCDFIADFSMLIML